MIAEALAQLTPKAEWIINGDSYEGITWLSSDITQPTKSEVTSKIAELEAGEPLRLLRRDRNQKLRDLPANTSDPNNPSWPTEPS